MIAIGNDHGALHLKKEIINYLTENKIEFIDFGTNEEKSTDYPIYAKKVTNAILEGKCDKGILLCGTGIGISITANRIKGIRAALCHDVFSAIATREHNDANVLAMGGRVVGAGLAVEILKAFLNTEFSNDERHINRIRKIDESE